MRSSSPSNLSFMSVFQLMVHDTRIERRECQRNRQVIRALFKS